ncbi:type VI secretion system ATPase TssH [Enterobacter hormaechei]|uniref:type VI secretion system ATPase TssH n=1 Tax=Enterobacter hormaechei TaxID=158836 RepID=UPI001886CE3F|nr:type VI secretion system ATPase TssH [Enterobacter hormaechei]MBF1962031.1 type VI secretion system ATPase TssH [Enterobacter hormaechei]MBF1979445.1 type VI secretion system ATPase TssH [Enterobacter hormaechei]
MENPASLLRRLNPYCARAMEGAASLCQTRAHAEILPEHWLLKLLEQGEGDITVLARRYEWDMDAIWQDLLGFLDALPRSVRSRPQLSETVQSLMQDAWLRASLGGEEQIRSIHLLMALAEKPSRVRCDGLWPLLTLAQSQLERLRPLLDAQSDERPEVQQEAELSQGGEVTFVGRPVGAELKDGELNPALQNALDKFTLDVTARAREGRIDPVFGRDNEIRQMVDILSRRRKNNPILVGEPGVGKTALVEGLALRIAEGNVPDALKPVSVRTLDLGLLQAGAGVKGEFEQRLKNIIDAVQQSPLPVLLFIDEAHTIIGAGNQAGGADAANLLKPALARGELRTIAATTWSEYKQYFERDAALERRFQMVKVDEPDDDTACLMLRGLKCRYAEHHGVHITDEAVKAAVSLSRRYLTGRQLPDKAVDLLDTASARIRMSLDTVPEALTRLKARLTALAMEKQALLEDIAVSNTTHGERLAAIEQDEIRIILQLDERETQYGQELKLTEELLACRTDISRQGEIADLQRQLTAVQQNTPLLGLDVDARTVATVIADWTGVPLSSLMKDEQTELLSLEHNLAKRVVGQDSALNAIAQRLRASKTGLAPENGPQGVFLLTGPSGTGKTETALALADELFGGEKSLITINLSEYQEPHTVSQLKGSPPGYVGYGQGGILTEAVRKRPYSVVLLDEVEKAHRDVMNLFYQVFDRGFMRDGEGREIDFRNTVILMTSNLGSDLIMQMLDEQPEVTEPDLHELLRPVLRDHFQPALLARFQTVIYRPLNRTAMRTIVEMKLAQVSKRLHRHYGLSTHIDESLYDALTDACLLPDTGARNIDSLLNQQILPVLSQQLLTHMAAKQKPQHLTLGWDEEEGIVLEFDEQTEGEAS